MILGLEKIEVSALLKTNGVFQYITGLPTFPHPTTLRRFLLRSASAFLPQLQVVHNTLRKHFMYLPQTRFSFWIDCDSTVKTLYGNQEGVTRGYNPKKRGAKSYHPSLITESHMGDCLAGALRPGNAYTSDGVHEQLKRVFDILPRHNRIRVRADSGFYDGDFVALLKEKHAHFAIAAVLTAPLKAKLGSKLTYLRVSKVFATAQFHYQPMGWKQKEKFVILRRKLPDEMDTEQITLFTLNRYAYSAVVTNMNLKPYHVFRFYHDRAAQERIVRVLKDDYPYGSAPTNSFTANALYAELSLLAYNLMIWFKRLCLPDDWQTYTLPTIRYRLLMIPGEFVKSRNIPTLRFPRNSPYQEVFYYAQKQIKKLAPLV